jgi:hypothetical protein
MGSVAPNHVVSGRVPAGLLLRVGVLAAVLSASANALVLAISSSLIGVVVIGRFTRRPIRIFWGVR